MEAVEIVFSTWIQDENVIIIIVDMVGLRKDGTLWDSTTKRIEDMKAGWSDVNVREGMSGTRRFGNPRCCH